MTRQGFPSAIKEGLRNPEEVEKAAAEIDSIADEHGDNILAAFELWRDGQYGQIADCSECGGDYNADRWEECPHCAEERQQTA